MDRVAARWAGFKIFFFLTKEYLEVALCPRWQLRTDEQQCADMDEDRKLTSMGIEEARLVSP